MGGVILIWDASPGLTAKSGWKLQQGLQWYLYQKGLNKEVFDNYVLKGVVFFFREDSFAFYSFSLTQSYCNM